MVIRPALSRAGAVPAAGAGVAIALEPARALRASTAHSQAAAWWEARSPAATAARPLSGLPRILPPQPAAARGAQARPLPRPGSAGRRDGRGGAQPLERVHGDRPAGATRQDAQAADTFSSAHNPTGNISIPVVTLHAIDGSRVSMCCSSGSTRARRPQAWTSCPRATDTVRSWDTRAASTRRTSRRPLDTRMYARQP